MPVYHLGCQIAPSVSAGTVSPAPRPRAELDFIQSRDGETAPTFGQFEVSWILSSVVFGSTCKNRSLACNVHYSGCSVHLCLEHRRNGLRLQRYMCWRTHCQGLREMDKVELSLSLRSCEKIEKSGT